MSVYLFVCPILKNHITSIHRISMLNSILQFFKLRVSNGKWFLIKSLYKMLTNAKNMLNIS
ncbi:hypothetical protein BpHYR1_039622 [Brachionus plicatilis]|uniref:Uncharacterized protein n=1 Tax=Brachionus plicatilis TaxID=10195 RepID=A0A3M7QP66_BRAPC|nr:hypothetical protein BpHYR1_039622 [Brachionus plicatilis]